MVRRLSTILLCTGALTACADASAPLLCSPSTESWKHRPGFPIFKHYVAMGTSISMGTASGGVLAASQQQSWVAQLSRRAGHPMTLPLISGTGCAAPYAAPLISFRRISGEPLTTPGISCTAPP